MQQNREPLRLRKHNFFFTTWLQLLIYNQLQNHQHNVLTRSVPTYFAKQGISSFFVIIEIQFRVYNISIRIGTIGTLCGIKINYNINAIVSYTSYSSSDVKLIGSIFHIWNRCEIHAVSLSDRVLI